VPHKKPGLCDQTTGIAASSVGLEPGSGFSITKGNSSTRNVGFSIRF
jgi:hypothetical protein